MARHTVFSETFTIKFHPKFKVQCPNLNNVSGKKSHGNSVIVLIRIFRWDRKRNAIWRGAGDRGGATVLFSSLPCLLMLLGPNQLISQSSQLQKGKQCLHTWCGSQQLLSLPGIFKFLNESPSVKTKLLVNSRRWFLTCYLKVLRESERLYWVW